MTNGYDNVYLRKLMDGVISCNTTEYFRETELVKRLIEPMNFQAQLVYSFVWPPTIKGMLYQKQLTVTVNVSPASVFIAIRICLQLGFYESMSTMKINC